MIRLQIFAGGQVERDESFAASEVTIGRTNANRLCLPANGVSARHCVIRRLGAGFELEDLDSTNGTYVNRRRVRGRVLVGPQDEIIVATFTVRIMDAALGPRPGQTISPGDDPDGSLSARDSGRRPAVGASSRQAKTFAPPLLPEASDIGEAVSKEQWPEPLPELEAAKSAEASGSFQLQAVSSGGADSTATYRVIDPLARAWQQQGKPSILLLEEGQLEMAQRWLDSEDASPKPSALHREFITQSQKQGKRSSRWIWVPVALVGCLGLAFGISRLALNDELSLELPKDMSGVLPRVSSRAATELTVSAMEPWLDKDPQSAVLASVAKLKSLGDQEDAETWAWESFLRKALRKTGGVVLAKTQAPVTSMVMLAKSKGWAVASQDGTLVISQKGSAKPVTLQAHEGSIRELLVDASGRWLYSWGQDKVIKRWDLSAPLTVKSAQELTGLGSEPVAVALSPDGRFFAAAGAKRVLRIWQGASPNPNEKAKNLGSTQKTVTALLWDQGRLFVGDRSGSIASWSTDGQKDRNPVNVGEGIAEMFMTPDHRVMIARGQERRSFRIRRKANRWGKVTGLGEIAASGILKVDHKGRFAISVASEGEILMWDPQSPDPARISVVIEGPGSAIEALSLNRSDQRMVAADERGALWSWDLAPKDGRIVPQSLHSETGDETVTALAFDAARSRWLVARSDGTVRAVDPGSTVKEDTSYVGRGHRGRLRSIAVNPAGTQVLSGADDQKVYLWALGAGGQLSVLRSLSGHRTPVTAVAFGPAGRFAYAAAQDGSVLTWDLQKPAAAPVRANHHSAEVYDMLVTKDGKWLISVGADAKVLAYALKGGALGTPKSLSGHKQAIFTVTSDPQSRFSISAGQDRGVVVWDLSKGLADAEGWRLDGHEKAIWAIAVSPDLKWIASAGEDRRIHIHRVSALAKREPPAFVLEGHQGTINALAFSPDSRWLVSGGADKGLRVWDLGSKRPQESPIVLTGHAQGIRALQFVAPGRLVSASRDGALRLWNLHLQDASAELLGHSAAIEDQVSARDGAIVLTGSQDKTLRSWPIARSSLIEAACRRVSGEMAPELQRKFFNGKSEPCASPSKPSKI